MKIVLLTVLLLALTVIADQSEEQLLNLHHNAFRPDSTTLCLVTATGDTLLFQDYQDYSHIEALKKFELIDYLSEQSIWVMEIHGFEWIEWKLVNENSGSVQQTIAPPLLSPDGTRILCMMEDLTAGYIPNGIEIWNLDNNGFKLEYEDIQEEWGPLNGEWRGNDRIIFDKLGYDFETTPGMLFMNGNGDWIPGNSDDWE